MGDTMPNPNRPLCLNQKPSGLNNCSITEHNTHCNGKCSVTCDSQLLTSPNSHMKNLSTTPLSVIKKLGKDVIDDSSKKKRKKKKKKKRYTSDSDSDASESSSDSD